MTKREAQILLTRRALQIEDVIRLDRESNGLFCFGITNEREIQIANKKWPEIIDALRPVVTYNPNWKCTLAQYTEASFVFEANGEKYKIYSLLNRRDPEEAQDDL